MSSSPPRLNINPSDPTAQPGYAPISWTAVASLAVAILFVVILVVAGYLASRDRQPLLLEPLLIFPAVAVLLAYVARKQIAASEGTRTGLVYATAGWWAAVVGGLGYAAYLFAINYDIRRQAEREFVVWSDNLKELDANNPKDSKLYAAAYLAVEPGVRRAVKSPEDIAGMDRQFGDRLNTFRQLDLIRICARNPGRVEFRPHGLQDWQQKPTEITCALAADLITPEGEHRIAVPLKAVMDEKTRQRSWYVNPPREGFVQSRKLTRYGWMVEHAEYTAKLFGQDFQGVLMSNGQAPLAYLGFIYPGMTLDAARQELGPVVGTAVGRAALGGSALGSLSVYPKLSDAEAKLRSVFTRPNGAPATPDQLRTFLFCWENPGRIGPAGSVLKGNPDTNPVLFLDATKIEYRIPVELALLADASGQAAARGRIVLRPEPASEAALLKELSAARDAAGSSPKTDEPPSDMQNRPKPAWRVVRIESDLIPQFNPKGPAAGGLPGMPGG